MENLRVFAYHIVYWPRTFLFILNAIIILLLFYLLLYLLVCFLAELIYPLLLNGALQLVVFPIKGAAFFFSFEIPICKGHSHEFDESVQHKFVDSWLFEVDKLKDGEDGILYDVESEKLEVYIEDLPLIFIHLLLLRNLPVEKFAFLDYILSRVG